jgi:lysophospholipase L1-like esterase
LAIAATILLVLELLLRLGAPPDSRWFSWPEQPLVGQAPVLARGNPYLLWELVPGRRDTPQGPVSINSLGMRGPEPGPHSRLRLLALGDDALHGAGLGDQEVWSAQLEARIPGLQALNAAVPGYSSTQAINLLLERGLRLQPEMLLVGTLWSDSSFEDYVDAEVFEHYSRWTEGPSGRVNRLLRRSLTFLWLDFGLSALRLRLSAGAKPRAEQPLTRRRVPLQDYAANLSRFCEEAQARDSGLLFVVPPHRSDLGSPSEDRPWRPYREVMRHVATACEAPLVDASEGLKRAGLGPEEAFLDELNLSAAGHRVLAEAIAAALSERAWPQVPLRARRVERLDLPRDEWEGRGISEVGHLPGPERAL